MAGMDAVGDATSHQSAQARHFTAMLLLLLLLTVGHRAAGITRPLVGNFSTKSVIYGMIARNWAEGRSGPVAPTLDVLVGGERSLHMLELPVSPLLTGTLWKCLGGSLDVWGRATSVAFLAAAVLALVALVRRRHGDAAALGAGLALALAPIGVVYGQTFMLEASILFFTLAAFVLADRWLLSGGRAWLVLAAVCLALLLLTKIYLIVLLLPLGAMALWPDRFGPTDRARGRLVDRLPAASAAVLLAVVPAALWCFYAWGVASPDSPQAGHIYFSLRDSAAGHLPPDPLLLTGEFYRQVLHDLATVVLTPVGLALFLTGFLHPDWRRYLPWLAAMALIVLALPRKFHEMNYYYMVVLPPLCILTGLGWQTVSERIRVSRGAVAGLLAVALLFSLRYSVKPAYVTPAEDRAVVAAGRAIQAMTPREEPVATMHGAGITLLYYCDRPGWCIDSDSGDLPSILTECRRRGARYLAVAGPEGEDGRFDSRIGRQPVATGEGYRIYALANPGGSDMIRSD